MLGEQDQTDWNTYVSDWAMINFGARFCVMLLKGPCSLQSRTGSRPYRDDAKADQKERRFRESGKEKGP